MKKHIILAVALFTALCNNIYSQDYAPNGGIFTPHGIEFILTEDQ